MLLLYCKEIGVGLEILVDLVLHFFLLQELLSFVCLYLFHNLCILLISLWIELSRYRICLEFVVQLTFYLFLLLLLPFSCSSLHNGLLLLS